MDGTRKPYLICREITVEIPVSVALSSCHEALVQAQRFLNLAHTGKTSIPLDENAPKRLEDASFCMLRHRRVTLLVEVDLDGNLTVRGVK